MEINILKCHRLIKFITVTHVNTHTRSIYTKTVAYWFNLCWDSYCNVLCRRSL